MRLFIAIPVPESVKDYANGVRQRLQSTDADVKWVEKENMHLTVKFLGEVKEDQLPSIDKELQKVGECCPAFMLSLYGIGFFPNKNRPRVIWMGVRGEIDKAEFLAERTDAYLATLGFEEERSHRFHLTLGRIRSDRNLKMFMHQVALEKEQLKHHSFRVDKIYLMESTLTASGPIYKKINSYALLG